MDFVCIVSVVVFVGGGDDGTACGTLGILFVEFVHVESARL